VSKEHAETEQRGRGLGIRERALRKAKRVLRRARSSTTTSATASAGRDMTQKAQALPMTCSNISRFLYFERFLQQIRDIEGDIVECGVGYGDSFVMLSILAKREGMGRRVWGFDSFEGFPQPTAEDQSPRNAQPAEWKSDVDVVVQRLRLAGLDEHFVNRQGTLVPGFFEASLDLFRGGKIALLHLDCDLYRSYRTCLEVLYPLVQPNGIVAFDEYVNTGQLRSFPGAQRAIDEYFGEQRHLIVSDRDTGQYYLVKPE